MNKPTCNSFICDDPACPVCMQWNWGPVKLSPKPIAISRWDHPEEWLRQYLARERPPVTHGWEGLDDETFTFFGVLRDGRVDESGYIE